MEFIARINFSSLSCVAVCMYVRTFYVRAEPYSLDCHGGAMKMYHCAPEKTTDFSWAQNCVGDSDGSRAVSGSGFQRAGPEYAKLFLSTSLCATVRDDEIALHCWTQVTPCGSCCDREVGEVDGCLTDVNTCIRARTSCTLSSVELTASAGAVSYTHLTLPTNREV